VWRGSSFTPPENVTGSARVTKEDEFLKQYEEKRDGELGKLIRRRPE